MWPVVGGGGWWWYQSTKSSTTTAKAVVVTLGVVLVPPPPTTGPECGANMKCPHSADNPPISRVAQYPPRAPVARNLPPSVPSMRATPSCSSGGLTVPPAKLEDCLSVPYTHLPLPTTHTQ